MSVPSPEEKDKTIRDQIRELVNAHNKERDLLLQWVKDDAESVGRPLALNTASNRLEASVSDLARSSGLEGFEPKSSFVALMDITVWLEDLAESVQHTRLTSHVGERHCREHRVLSARHALQRMWLTTPAISYLNSTTLVFPRTELLTKFISDNLPCLDQLGTSSGIFDQAARVASAVCDRDTSSTSGTDESEFDSITDEDTTSITRLFGRTASCSDVLGLVNSSFVFSKGIAWSVEAIAAHSSRRDDIIQFLALNACAHLLLIFVTHRDRSCLAPSAVPGRLRWWDFTSLLEGKETLDVTSDSDPGLVFRSLINNHNLLSSLLKTDILASSAQVGFFTAVMTAARNGFQSKSLIRALPLPA